MSGSPKIFYRCLIAFVLGPVGRKWICLIHWISITISKLHKRHTIGTHFDDDFVNHNVPLGVVSVCISTAYNIHHGRRGRRNGQKKILKSAGFACFLLEIYQVEIWRTIIFWLRLQVNSILFWKAITLVHYHCFLMLLHVCMTAVVLFSPLQITYIFIVLRVFFLIKKLLMSKIEKCGSNASPTTVELFQPWAILDP